jgi:hypothetical protein
VHGLPLAEGQKAAAAMLYLFLVTWNVVHAAAVGHNKLLAASIAVAWLEAEKPAAARDMARTENICRLVLAIPILAVLPKHAPFGFHGVLGAALPRVFHNNGCATVVADYRDARQELWQEGRSGLDNLVPGLGGFGPGEFRRLIWIDAHSHLLTLLRPFPQPVLRTAGG